MRYWKQRTSGDRSPIVGGDLYDGWKIEDLLDAYVEQKTENNALRGELEQEKFTKSWWIKGSSFVCLILLGMLITVQNDSEPRPLAAEKPAASPLPLEATLHAAPLPCAQGKWIAVLGSWHRKEGRAGDLLYKFGEVQSRAKTNGFQLHINYTLLDKKQCDTLRKDFYILWNGPHPDSAAAISVCRRLGWKTKADDYWCYAVVIDQSYSGKRHIRPDEGST